MMIERTIEITEAQSQKLLRLQHVALAAKNAADLARATFQLYASAVLDGHDMSGIWQVSQISEKTITVQNSALKVEADEDAERDQVAEQG